MPLSNKGASSTITDHGERVESIARCQLSSIGAEGRDEELLMKPSPNHKENGVKRGITYMPKTACLTGAASLLIFATGDRVIKD